MVKTILNGFYGCARRHRIEKPGFIISTNDIEPKCYCNYTIDIRQLLFCKPFMEIFDFYIFTPPCNYYSRANYRRETSSVALETKDILPKVLLFCAFCDKPFIVENVNNKSLLGDFFPQYQIKFGGHTFWTNILTQADLNSLVPLKQNKQSVCRNKRDNNYNVHIVFNLFLNRVRDWYNCKDEYNIR